MITGAGLDGTLLTMLARDGEVFFVLLRASSLVLPEERPGKSSAPPFITLRVSSLILPEERPGQLSAPPFVTLRVLLFLPECQPVSHKQHPRSQS